MDFEEDVEDVEEVRGRLVVGEGSVVVVDSSVTEVESSESMIVVREFFVKSSREWVVSEESRS